MVIGEISQKCNRLWQLSPWDQEALRVIFIVGPAGAGPLGAASKVSYHNFTTSYST